MHGYLSADITFPVMPFEDQIMFKDKYASVISGQMEVCVYRPSNISVNARENCLQSANCLRLRMFAFQCYLVQFYEQKQYIFLLLYSQPCSLIFN